MRVITWKTKQNKDRRDNFTNIHDAKKRKRTRIRVQRGKKIS